MDQIQTNTIIIGSSAAGLACAACLNRHRVPYILLEQHPHVGHLWRSHYDRLHLNTEKKYSSLPYLSFPKDAPVYVSKNEMAAYLENYMQKFDIKPEFNQKVFSVQQADELWEVNTAEKKYCAKNIIIATGLSRQPFEPHWEGIEEFKGKIIHSSRYKNGIPFKGQQVLVVGFGNSACEISICLHEHGAYPSLSVKGAVNIIPRGNGTSRLSSFFDSFAWVTKLAPALIDSINAPFLRSKYGDYSKYGLQKLPYGPNIQIVKYKRLPLLDIGTFELIKKGIIKVYQGIERFTPDGVIFGDGQEHAFDAVILGTGYRAALSDFLPYSLDVTDKEGKPSGSGVESTLRGLYFCGFNTSPLGMLREIGMEAKKIARAIAKKR
jgi:indole-3-pyruvate monooxygenase